MLLGLDEINQEYQNRNYFLRSLSQDETEQLRINLQRIPCEHISDEECSDFAEEGGINKNFDSTVGSVA